MRPLLSSLTRQEMVQYIIENSPEFAVNENGWVPMTYKKYQDTPAPADVAWFRYQQLGPWDESGKARNAHVRELVTSLWPEVEFKVRSGLGSHAFVGWSLGPAVQTVKEQLWACETITPAQAFCVDLQRQPVFYTLALAVFRNEGPNGVDTFTVSEKEHAMITTLASLLGYGLTDPSNRVSPRTKQGMVQSIRAFAQAAQATFV